MSLHSNSWNLNSSKRGARHLFSRKNKTPSSCSFHQNVTGGFIPSKKQYMNASRRSRYGKNPSKPSAKSSSRRSAAHNSTRKTRA